MKNDYQIHAAQMIVMYGTKEKAIKQMDHVIKYCKEDKDIPGVRTESGIKDQKESAYYRKVRAEINKLED